MGIRVRPEDELLGPSSEAAPHSKPIQASARPSMPSLPDKDDEEETNKDHVYDSDDDIPEFPGFVFEYALHLVVAHHSISLTCRGAPRGKIVGPVTGGQSGRPIRPVVIARPK